MKHFCNSLLFCGSTQIGQRVVDHLNVCCGQLRHTTLSLLLVVAALLLPQRSVGQVGMLLPKPQSVVLPEQAGGLVLRFGTLDCSIVAEEWIEQIERCGGSFDAQSSATLTVRQVAKIEGCARATDEAYRMVVDADGITVEVSGRRGAFWAMQTLGQLACNGAVEWCTVVDWPAFEVRGVMHDVGRGFIEVEELEHQIEMLAKMKINTFHWHLTENEAWRLEIMRYPQLTAAQHMTRHQGRFYSHDDVRRVVDFAYRHGVRVIPEIDVPGHSAAFVRAMGCDMQSQEGMAILKNIFDEACQLFPDPYIHIGTDEVAFTNPDFVPQMVEYIRAKGKKVISWNPGWNYSAGQIDALHLWSYRGRPHDAIPFIDSKFLYANHFDSYSDIVALFMSRVCNVEQGSDEALGAIVAFWNDRALRADDSIAEQNNLISSVAAVAERAWRGGGYEYFDRCGVVLPDRLSPAFADFADFEQRLCHHAKTTFAEESILYTPQCNVEWRVTDPFPNEGVLTAVFPPEAGLSESFQYEGKSYNTRKVVGSAVMLRHTWGTLVPALYANPQPNHTAYAFTSVWSPNQRTVGAIVETQNYSRSESDLPPRQGHWDWRESRIWLNGKAVEPPVWLSSHASRSNTIPLTNENATAREPLKIELHKGWNDLLVKLPVGQFSTPEVRLQKWGFTFALVDSLGGAMDDLVWSSDRNLFGVETVAGYPDTQGYRQGVSAHFLGLHNGMIIMAGGCNFPDLPACDGGKKRYYSDIYVAEPSAAPTLVWRRAGQLPREVAYGVSVSTDRGVVCAGGMNDNGSINDVWRLAWRNGRVEVEQFDNLPVGVDNAAGCLCDGKIYIAGGNIGSKPSTALFSADVNNMQWQRLADFPLPARTQPVCFAAKDDKGRPTVFVAGGFAPSVDGSEPSVSTDVIGYDVKRGRWSKAVETGFSTGGATAVVSNGKVLCTGGVSGEIFLGALERGRQLSLATDPAVRDSLVAANREYMLHEREWYEFNDCILMFDTRTASWSVAGRSDALSRAGASSVATDNGIYIVGGESKPGIRTPTIVRLRPADHHPINR